MKKIIAPILIFIGATSLYYCTSTKLVLNTPGNTELAIAQKTWPNASLQSLESGRVIYTTKCNTCHELKTINNRSEADWKHEIDDMSPKAKLTADEKELLTQYILSVRMIK